MANATISEAFPLPVFVTNASASGSLPADFIVGSRWSATTLVGPADHAEIEIMAIDGEWIKAKMLGPNTYDLSLRPASLNVAWRKITA